MSDKSMDGVYAKHVIELITVANEFCRFSEESENYTAEELLNFYQKVAPLLYIKGALIQPIGISNPDANEKFVTEEQWENIYLILKEKFGEKDSYDTIKKDEITGTEIIKGSLSELIADVYQDMKDFITLYQKNTHEAKEHAINDIYQYFFSHWGNRIIKIQSVVHAILANQPRTV